VIFIGWDPREETAWKVAKASVEKHLSRPVPVSSLCLEELREAGLYRRPTETRDGRLWDVISGAPMATQHACARFLIKELAGSGWVVFMDGDVLVRADLAELIDTLDTSKAVYCVKHRHEPTATEKMDGQVQTRYFRKNWSSMMIINCDHPANSKLTVELVNTVPGRDLHAFCWLEDDEIGALDTGWNYLVPTDVKIAHFTEGVPDMPGYEQQPFADEWREFARWV